MRYRTRQGLLRSRRSGKPNARRAKAYTNERKPVWRENRHRPHRVELVRTAQQRGLVESIQSIINLKHGITKVTRTVRHWSRNRAANLPRNPDAHSKRRQCGYGQPSPSIRRRVASQHARSISKRGGQELQACAIWSRYRASGSVKPSPGRWRGSLTHPGSAVPAGSRTHHAVRRHIRSRLRLERDPRRRGPWRQSALFCRQCRGSPKWAH